MLTADRPELARRAVECFRRQTYQRKYLAVWDSGVKASSIEAGDDELWIRETPSGEPIGTLRNSLVRVCGPADIIVHLDDDDWSHPNRIAEQVALLQSSGADCVGYREMLFWRSASGPTDVDPMERAMPVHPGEAWLYSNANPGYTLGTSLCYWRKTWERKPFPATNVGEDLQFCTGLKCVGTPSIIQDGWPMHFGWRGGHRSAEEAAKHGDVSSYEPQGLISAAWADSLPKAEPRMIARIHAGNTSTAYDPAKMAKNSEWKRVPEWDAHCRSVME